MTQYAVVSWCVCCVVVVLHTQLALTEPPPPQVGVPTPPARPKVFKNPHELKSYLRALNEYYAVVGRPRFGKRSQIGSSRHDLIDNTVLNNLLSKLLDLVEQTENIETRKLPQFGSHPRGSWRQDTLDTTNEFDDYY